MGVCRGAQALRDAGDAQGLTNPPLAHGGIIDTVVGVDERKQRADQPPVDSSGADAVQNSDGLPDSHCADNILPGNSRFCRGRCRSNLRRSGNGGNGGNGGYGRIRRGRMDSFMDFIHNSVLLFHNRRTRQANGVRARPACPTFFYQTLCAAQIGRLVIIAQGICHSNVFRNGCPPPDRMYSVCAVFS